MWSCPSCSETVEDTFDLCWNCGTLRDGTVDPAFERVPEDAAVADPGEESQLEFPPDAPANWISRRHLDRRELATLISKKRWP